MDMHRNMNGVCVCVLVCLMAWAASADANNADSTKPYRNQSKWRMRQFMVSIWGAPTDEASAKLYADTGLNVVMAPANMLDTCAKHGLQVIVMGVAPADVARIKDHPAVWGYFVVDEPWDQEAYDKAAAAAEAIRKVDYTHPCYINLGGAMEQHSTFIDTVKPDFLSFDFYQWWWANKYGDHFSRLEGYRKAALDADLPLLCWVEISVDPRHEFGEAGRTYLPDNPQKLRHSVYTELAYGVKGIQWFNETLAFRKGTDGALIWTQAGDDIAAIDAELNALGPILINLTSTEVFHTAPLPATCRMLPPSYFVTTRNRNVVIGVFKDRKDKTFFMVVNRDWHRTRSIRLEFDASVSAVESFDRSKRRWNSVLESCGRGGGEAVLAMVPGDGVLLRVKRR